jgi:Raf kinase inhibitor-like YbhB/YbcL family protein
MLKKVLTTMTLGVGLLMAGNFTLTSSDLHGQLSKKQEFDGFGCSGENLSPQLSWKDAPKDTKSFAITLYDPDVPTGSGWWHWVVVNIPANVTSLPTGASGKAMPKGALEITNDYGTVGFGGPCPPKGDKPHRYIVTVYALDVPRLDLKPDTNDPVAGFMINAHTIAKASLISYYGR